MQRELQRQKIDLSKSDKSVEQRLNLRRRGTKATLVFTIPRSIFKSSA